MVDLFNPLFTNIYLSDYFENFRFLREDFIGFSINPYGILLFIGQVLFTLILFFIFYYLGHVINLFIGIKDKTYRFFVNIAIGFIFIGTSIAILGTLNLIYFETIFFLILINLFLALYIFYKKNDYTKLLFLKKITVPKNVFSKIVLILIFISFIRLLLPEIHEDGYHTDLAKLYYSTHTLNHEARDPLLVIPYAQLPEMIYVIPIAFQIKEATRIIHFGFYLLTITLLFRYSLINKYAKFAPFLFTTLPLTIRYSSSQYTDFFMIYFFLLSILILSSQNLKKGFVSGLLYGGVLSTKMWTIVFLPILSLIFFLSKNRFNKNLYALLTFLIASILISFFWQLRSFIQTDSPFAPFLANATYIGRPLISHDETQALANQALENNILFIYKNINVIGPIFILGILIFLIKFNSFKKILLKNGLLLFFLLLTFLYLIINFYGRYLFPWLVISTIFISYGLYTTIEKFKPLKFTFAAFSFIFIFYYLVNSLILLPYSFGWANINNYLTRVLIRDHASFYNFGNRFEKYINKNDKVATYEIMSFYHTDFIHLDVNFIFDKNNLSFNLLKKSGMTKLLIKGENIKSFCARLKLTSCNENKAQYLTSYIDGDHKFYLYKLK